VEFLFLSSLLVEVSQRLEGVEEVGVDFEGFQIVFLGIGQISFGGVGVGQVVVGVRNMRIDAD